MMKTALLKLIYLGADTADPFENRRIFATNLLSLLSLVMTGCYTAFFLSVSWWAPVFAYLPFIVVHLLVFALNRRGYHRLSSIIILYALTLKLTLFPLLFLGREAGLHFFLLVLPAASFLIIAKRDRNWLALYIIYSYASFMLAEYTPWQPPYRPAGMDHYLRYFHAVSLTAVMGSIAILIASFYTKLNRAQEELALEHRRAEKLLHNILPAPIAERLKREPHSIAERFPAATILFADLVGFTAFSEQTAPDKLVEILNQLFSSFDDLTDRFGLEKIKTIGDAYMVAGGIPIPQPRHAETVAEMGLAMLAEVKRFNTTHHHQFQLRIGIHSGEVVAGVIGCKKFSYDLWGDAVNTASRMESHGVAGAIQVSESTYSLLQESYRFTERGIIEVKGKGEMRLYLLQGRKEAKSAFELEPGKR